MHQCILFNLRGDLQADRTRGYKREVRKGTDAEYLEYSSLQDPRTEERQEGCLGRDTFYSLVFTFHNCWTG